MAVVSAPAPPVAPAATPTDEDLLRRFSAGDGVAFDELFRRHCGRAYRVAYRLLGNEADALDAVQDGFVKVLTNLRGFAGRSSFKTWLLRIVSNAALDLGRKRQVRAASPDEHRNSDETSPVTWDDPARGMVNGELRRRSLPHSLACPKRKGKHLSFTPRAK